MIADKGKSLIESFEKLKEALEGYLAYLQEHAKQVAASHADSQKHSQACNDFMQRSIETLSKREP